MNIGQCDRPTLEARRTVESDPRAEEIEDRKACARSLVQKLLGDLAIQNKHDWVLDELISGIKDTLHDTIGEGE